MAADRNAPLKLEDSAAEQPPVPRRLRPRPVPAEAGRGLQWAVRTGLGVLIVSALLLGLYHLNRLLVTHPRFALPGEPGDPDNRSLEIQGVRYTPLREITRVFAADFGRSVYLVPLRERRRQLMAIDWVREATVERRWPNRLVVRISERAPVAFVLLAEAGREGTHRPALIDAEGVLLRPPAREPFELPVLFGVSDRQSREARRRSVVLMLQLLEQAGEHASEIAEVDVSDPDNVTLTVSRGGRTLQLRIGRENFGTRLKNFFQYYAGVRRQKPEADLFDLRVDGQIAAEVAHSSRAGQAAPQAAGAGQRNKDAP